MSNVPRFSKSNTSKQDTNATPTDCLVNKRLSAAVSVNRCHPNFVAFSTATRNFLKKYNSTYATQVLSASAHSLTLAQHFQLWNCPVFPHSSLAIAGRKQSSPRHVYYGTRPAFFVAEPPLPQFSPRPFLCNLSLSNFFRQIFCCALIPHPLIPS